MSEKPRFTVISIDGGAATGKSSTARGVSRLLSYLHVDTGSHYRAVTLALLRAGVSPEEPSAVEFALQGIRLSSAVVDLEAVLEVDGVAPDGADLRSSEVNAAVSRVAAIPDVRHFLFSFQRAQVDLARNHGFPGVVMEGRDIGSVILPDADFRFFLYADERTREARRAGQGQADSISKRDAIDAGRKTAPLVCPEGAIRIDTGTMDLAGVVEAIGGYVRKGQEATVRGA